VEFPALNNNVGPFNTAIGASFASFTSRQDVSCQPLPTVNANSLRAQTKIHISACGEFSTTATPTLVWGLYIGTAAASITTVIAESSVITTGSGAAAWPWTMVWDGICTANGVSGSVTGTGILVYGTSLTAVTVVPIPITLALRTFTWDTTIARSVGVCATYSASSSSNAIKTYDLSVTLRN
jgi:hypothetical protein